MAATDSPRVFVSSTLDDLKRWRDAACEAISRAGYKPVRCEEFSAAAQPPLSLCLEELGKCRIVVVLVGHCYGSIAKETGDSYTESECRDAERLGLKVLPFFVDPEYDFPLKGKLRAFAAANYERLEPLCNYLGNNTRAKFGSPENLLHLVYQALIELRPGGPTADFASYARWLETQTGFIDIRGLVIGNEHAHRVPIGKIFIPLTTSAAAPKTKRKKDQFPRHMPLEEALEKRRLVIVGHPGSGKTTFLRRIVNLRAAAYLAGSAAPLPLLIRISEFARHLAAPDGPTTDGPLSIPHFLAAQAVANGIAVPAEAFEQTLRNGATLFLDGLDEAPDERLRRRVADIFEAAAGLYTKSSIVVTTRPRAFEGQGLLTGFDRATIDPLDDDSVDTFLAQWSAHVHEKDKRQAERHAEDLTSALRQKPEIRDLARTPVMLTALAVVHWNERRIPEQRAELYKSIVRWLAESRRGESPKILEALAELAYRMLDHPDGRKVDAARNWAADQIVGYFDGSRERALEFLAREELASGIIVGNGADVRFWHLTFLEYLAAVHLNAMPETPRAEALIKSHKAFRPEWRETVLLLAGVLQANGPAHVDELVKQLIDEFGSATELQRRAALVGLVGGIVRDLETRAYAPADKRWASLATSILGIFDRQQAREIPFQERLDAAEALGLAGDPRLQKTEWIHLPGGTFLMGAQKTDKNAPGYDKDANDREAPVHRVTLRAFSLAKYPLTVAEYAAFVRADGYQRPEFWKSGGFGEFTEPGSWAAQQKHPNRPVVEVSWYEAAAYCAWRGVRLPTEAEWEYAARGAEGRFYPWGSAPAESHLANYAGGPGHPTPVGLYPEGQSPEGCCDLAGNVWEWLSDWHSDYMSKPEQDPTEPSKGEHKNLRGGSWYGNPGACGAPAVAGTRRRCASMTSASAWPGTGKPLRLDP